MQKGVGTSLCKIPEAMADAGSGEGPRSPRELPMTDELRPDICVIGAGAAGLSVAVVAAGLGVPTVLIEKGAMALEQIREAMRKP